MLARKLLGLVTIAPMLLTASATAAWAQPPPPPAAGPTGPSLTPAADEDGVRFRGGVSAVAGGMFISDYSGFLAGVDGRLGLQINDLIGVYAVPHLTFGPVSTGAGAVQVSSVIGVFSATGVVDATFIDQVFVGGGAGFGVVNNPSGPVIHFRAGGYPLMGDGDGARRKGLMLGADLRLFVLSGATVMQVTGGIGYEAF